MRRSKLLFAMKTTISMDNKKPLVALPLALWPIALCNSSPRRPPHANNRHAPITSSSIVIGPTVGFCLIRQNMMLSNVYLHTAAVYRFEKIRAYRRVQRWWRREERASYRTMIMIRTTNSLL
jgi:hypothetical protein